MTTAAFPPSSPVRTRPFPAWPRPPQGLSERLEQLLASGHWWQSGDGAAEELESWLRAEHQALSCVAVANGTVALEISFRALDIGPGDEVIVPATTFVSSATAVSTVGATPVPVDVDPTTWCLDLDRAAEALTPRTRAVVVVHLAGQPANLPAARSFCDRHGLALVEDSAQATTASWGAHRVGTVGDITTTSFQAAKLLPGGDGGAVLIKSDPQLARRVELLANCGRPRGSGSYAFELIGTNARISEFAAATVMAHVAEYEELWRIRDQTAGRLRRALQCIDPGMVLPPHPEVTRHDWYMFMLQIPATWREAGLGNIAFTAHLNAQGIPAAVIYPPWHHVPAYRGALGDTPVAGHAGEHGIWLHHRLLLDSDTAEDVATAVMHLTEAAAASALQPGGHHAH
ncbi:DegT/DnrJ/EryC1/StrS aminotransferase family protein [Streptomyces cellostaticus]|uniref:DegT/DnrJ/EryC1/StrS aminotransferase family protein n=1 Tax=Streptomyces cellostaticus TaxID=67285 RepID=UPI00202668CA|nr:DegT/DnrJ/EryC1/StrS family aminotransferase [Streptomyces cellostaticus]